MKRSDMNHLRRLLGWVRCDIDQSPAEQQQTMINVADKLGHPEISDEARARVVERYRRAEAVPQYVRDAVKALEKAVLAAGREGGHLDAQNRPESRVNTEDGDGLLAGREGDAAADAPGCHQIPAPVPALCQGAGAPQNRRSSEKLQAMQEDIALDPMAGTGHIPRKPTAPHLPRLEAREAEPSKADACASLGSSIARQADRINAPSSDALRTEKDAPIGGRA